MIGKDDGKSKDKDKGKAESSQQIVACHASAGWLRSSEIILVRRISMKLRNLLIVLLSASVTFLALKSVVQAQNTVASSTLCETGCLLPPTGLVGWWPGDGNTNDIQLGSNGTLVNGATFAPGLVGQAFSFDGVNAFVDIPDTPALHAVTTAFTIDAWINPQPSLQEFGGWILARRDPFVSEGFGLQINNDGFLATQMRANAYFSIASTVPVIQFNGQWQHVAVTADTANSSVLLYVNGRAVPLQAGNGSPTSGTFANVSHLFIGQRQSSDTPEARSVVVTTRA